MSFCVNCGSQLLEGAKFCQECGTPVNSSSSVILEDTFESQFTEAEEIEEDIDSAQEPDAYNSSPSKPVSKPKTYLGLSIFSCFWFLPLGLAAVICSIRSARQTTPSEAIRIGTRAKKIALWTIALGVISLIGRFAEVYQW